MAEKSQVTRLNRTQADEIAQTLDTMSVMSFDHPDAHEHCAQAFASAADAIRILAKQKALTPETNEAYQASGYFLDMDEENHRMRLAFYQGDPKNARSFLVLDSPEIYDMAILMLKKYDILEGIK